MRYLKWVYRPDLLPHGCVETDDRYSRRICDVEDPKAGPVLAAAPELLEAVKTLLAELTTEIKLSSDYNDWSRPKELQTLEKYYELIRRAGGS